MCGAIPRRIGEFVKRCDKTIPASNAGLFILTGIALVPRGRVEHVSDLPPACDFTYVFYS